MKYLICILILVSLGFSQDVYRLNDSTFVYPCVTTDSTSYNFVGLPVQTDFVNVSDFDTAGVNINAISRYNAQLQGWEGAGYHPALGWVNDFPTEAGGAYLINALNNFDFVVIGDSVDFQYNLLSPTTGYNGIVHPLNKAIFTESKSLLMDIESYNSISKFENTVQLWHNCSNNFFMWLGIFETHPGKVLLVNVNAPSTWPTLKKKINTETKEILSDYDYNLPSKTVYFRVTDELGNDFSIPSDSLSYLAHIKGRESEVLGLNGYGPGCGFLMHDTYSNGFINVSGFATPCSIGDTLVVRIEDRTDPDTANWTYGETEYEIVDGSNPMFRGFEDIIPGSGQPIKTDSYVYAPLSEVSTSSNTEGTVVTVNWNAVIDATSYNLYWSDDPYEGFEFITSTTETFWQFAAGGDKKFYRVTAVYEDKGEE